MLLIQYLNTVKAFISEQYLLSILSTKSIYFGILKFLFLFNILTNLEGEVIFNSLECLELYKSKKKKITKLTEKYHKNFGNVMI